eukprot:11716173-Alexandrium_andersonii.AAC.1
MQFCGALRRQSALFGAVRRSQPAAESAEKRRLSPTSAENCIMEFSAELSCPNPCWAFGGGHLRPS